MLDRDIDNGMTLFAERPQIMRTCPHCGAEWEEIIDRDPSGIGTVWYEHDFDLTRSYPIHKGFCRACAMESATAEDRVAYILEQNLLCAFLASRIQSVMIEKLNIRDMITMWDAALRLDADALDQALREYIEDMHENDFINWRCS